MRTVAQRSGPNLLACGRACGQCKNWNWQAQPYSEEAKAWLTNYILNRRVTVRLHRRDQYSRAVRNMGEQRERVGPPLKVSNGRLLS